MFAHDTVIPSRLIGEEASFPPSAKPWFRDLLKVGEETLCTATMQGLLSMDCTCDRLPTEPKIQ